MSKEAIKRFNYIAGNAPLGIDADPKDIWSQIELLAKLVKEEADEMYDAALVRDIREVLDGSEDVYYLRTYMDNLLSALGIDVAGARYEVARNNEQKFTTSEDLAIETWVEYIKQGKVPYVDSVDYEGKTYYTVKIDGKVQKLLHHVKPNLDKCIPNEVKEKLNG